MKATKPDSSYTVEVYPYGAYAVKGKKMPASQLASIIQDYQLQNNDMIFIVQELASVMGALIVFGTTYGLNELEKKYEKESEELRIANKLQD